jgi:hypothetical protein
MPVCVRQDFSAGPRGSIPVTEHHGALVAQQVVGRLMGMAVDQRVSAGVSASAGHIGICISKHEVVCLLALALLAPCDAPWLDARPKAAGSRLYRRRCAPISENCWHATSSTHRASIGQQQ